MTDTVGKFMPPEHAALLEHLVSRLHQRLEQELYLAFPAGGSVNEDDWSLIAVIAGTQFLAELFAYVLRTPDTASEQMMREMFERHLALTRASKTQHEAADVASGFVPSAVQTMALDAGVGGRTRAAGGAAGVKRAKREKVVTHAN